MGEGKKFVIPSIAEPGNPRTDHGNYTKPLGIPSQGDDRRDCLLEVVGSQQNLVSPHALTR